MEGFGSHDLIRYVTPGLGRILDFEEPYLVSTVEGEIFWMFHSALIAWEGYG